jgi:DNA-binding NarL/FixJ family response regulator
MENLKGELMSVSILLADDHAILRQGLSSLLSSEPEFQIIGEANDGVEAIQLAERLKPDVLILDLMMPGVNGLEVTRQIRQHLPNIRIVILSMHSKEAYVLEAMKYGADAYVLKDSQAVELVKAVQEVIDGRRYLSPPLSERAIEAYIQKTHTNSLDIYQTLTGREREVVQLAAEGNSNAEIGTRLGISPRTVEIHRSNMMRKLNLSSQTDLIRFALQRGIIE